MFKGELKRFTCEQISAMVLTKMKETAEAYYLPVAAVEEAWDYYQENRPLVDEEVAQERNAAGLASC